MEGVLGKEEKTDEEKVNELDKGLKDVKINEDLFKEENLDELDDIADEDDKKEDEKEEDKKEDEKE